MQQQRNPFFLFLSKDYEGGRNSVGENELQVARIFLDASLAEFQKHLLGETESPTTTAITRKHRTGCGLIFLTQIIAWF